MPSVSTASFNGRRWCGNVLCVKQHFFLLYTVSSLWWSLNRYGVESVTIHSVKSMVEFDQHHLPEPAETSLPTDANQEGRRFRYRTTLVDGRPPLQRRARPPVLDAWQRREQQRQLYQSRQRQKAVMAKEKRRTVYANNLWVQHVPQRGKPKFRDISAEFLRANPACIHRLVPWLSRELHVLLDDDQSTVELVMPLITRLITRVEIQSDEFAEQLQQFLFDKSYHFAHEFASFARSPFDMSTYDDRAEYNKPKNPTSVDPGTPVVFQSSSTGWDSPDTASPLAVLPASDTTCLSGFTSLPGPSGVTAFSQPSRWDDGQTNRHLSNNWSPPSEANPYIPTIHIRDESTSPESVRMQEVSPSSETSRRTVSGHSAKEDRTSKKRKKARKHKRKRKHSKHKSEKQSIENGRPTRTQPGGSLNSSSRSRTKSRSRSRIRSRSPARSRSWSHTRSRSRSHTRSRSRSHTRSRSRSRIRSRSRSQELDSRTLRSKKSFERRSRASHRESRSRSKSRTKRERSRKKSRSRSRPRSRSRSRGDSLTGFHSTSLSDRSHKTAGASRSRQVEPNSKEDRSLPAPASPTEAEMKQEIAELEIRIAADRKRLLELLQKQKERKTEEAHENVDGCGGEETCDKNILSDS
ncbi:E3 ubiquitin-protein ligase Topors isoform X2 [Nematostella vectensis]|uniref:E3 ubiquitin-protein ligase Topors isoform X2 n=1 Tax=Nematostella vectensis TaxID=45351 RepID=UPI002076D6F4|nr:E3 ubiquitin-protein ligase Topors isoform X2 [Nematostella vectensis]